MTYRKFGILGLTALSLLAAPALADSQMSPSGGIGVNGSVDNKLGLTTSLPDIRTGVGINTDTRIHRDTTAYNDRSDQVFIDNRDRIRARSQSDFDLQNDATVGQRRLYHPNGGVSSSVNSSVNTSLGVQR